MTTTIWECKIGEVHSVAGGADYLMRQAVADAYKAQTGVEPVFIFSGWGASLTEAERAAVENRLPAPATAPAWHVAPTVPGLWLNSVFMKVEDVEQWHIDCQLHLECARWFGPIPPDGDKP